MVSAELCSSFQVKQNRIQTLKCNLLQLVSNIKMSFLKKNIPRRQNAMGPKLASPRVAEDPREAHFAERHLEGQRGNGEADSYQAAGKDVWGKMNVFPQTVYWVLS